MVQNISIIGGDLRIAYLAKMLAKENYKIKIYGLEKIEQFKDESNINICNSLEDAIKENEFIISGIPFSKDGKNIYMPLGNKEILIKDFFNKIVSKTLIAGSIREDIVKIAKNNNVKIIDLMNYEKLAINNTIATAEGTIELAIKETSYNISDSKVLVLGFGKVGKIVAERFYGLKADVYCEARKENDIAWINAYGYKAIHLNKLNNELSKFDIIINTIPAKIINKEQLKFIKKECLIIDLASQPGGVDFEKAEQYNIKTIHALGLPGKVAPLSSAKFMKEIIKEINEN